MVSVLEVEVKFNLPNVDGLTLPVTPLYIGSTRRLANPPIKIVDLLTFCWGALE